MPRALSFIIVFVKLACREMSSHVMHSVLLSRPFLGLETKTETLDCRSRDRDLDKMNSRALESHCMHREFPFRPPEAFAMCVLFQSHTLAYMIMFTEKLGTSYLRSLIAESSGTKFRTVLWLLSVSVLSRFKLLTT